jgi:hypothetical protein
MQRCQLAHVEGVLRDQRVLSDEAGDVGEACFGILTGAPFVSKNRTPCERNTDAASNGCTRIRWTWSGVKVEVGPIAVALPEVVTPTGMGGS